MEKSHLALKLMLDELGLSTNISSVKERKTLQKGVYLGQAVGVDLGYSYNWYHMGPYSPGLTRDYFGLQESIASGDDESSKYSLQQPVRDSLTKLRRMMDVPGDVKLDQADWLELLASVHYLSKRRLDQAKIKERLAKEKGHVAQFADQALEVLQNERMITIAA